jgi:hypothetical protein
MPRSHAILQLAGQMASILTLALTGRFIGYAQATLESGGPLTTGRAVGFVADILAINARPERLALLAAVLAAASLIRIGIGYLNRSVLLALRERAGIADEGLSWGQRALRLPISVLYRAASGIATLVGGLALAVCYRLFDPFNPFGLAELSAYAGSVAGGISYATIGALFVLFALYGLALAVVGYIASPAVLTLEEMASGCRPRRDGRRDRQPA